jgi:site-specific recombinase XerD
MMNLPAGRQGLPENFRRYLTHQQLSAVTVRNYVVDIRHFLDWLKQKTQIDYRIAGRKIFGLFTPETLGEYKTDLATSQTPLATINRRLSALRKFGQFARSQGWLGQNFAQQVENAHPAINLSEAFRKHLEKQKISAVTIKNYLSDVRQFLAWLEA